jgi:hypothetical protein
VASVRLRPVLDISGDWTVVPSFWAVIDWRRGNFWINVRSIRHDNSIIEIAVAADGDDPIKCGVSSGSVLVVLFDIRISNTRVIV